MIIVRYYIGTKTITLITGKTQTPAFVECVEIFMRQLPLSDDEAHI